MTSNFDSRGLYFPNSKNAGRPPNIVWTHFNKGSPQLMQEHLANRCPNVPVDVKQVFLEIILRKHQDDNFFDATDSLTTSNSSNSSNILGTRIELELKRQNNITLAMDGWTDPAGISIYNYVALTSNGKEYLLKLMDYSQFSHTADFLANEIEQTLVLNNIERFSDEIGTEEENHFLNSHYEQDESDDITYLDNNDENEESDIDILKIEDIVNLNDPIFDTSENAIINEGTQERRVETMNYLAEDIVQEFLAEFEDT
ncbi:11762_t:CDS:2 [Entrophospora sp. SA101]|nr:11762_t:CDS:2 [Entrophospora sp. SA101]